MAYMIYLGGFVFSTKTAPYDSSSRQTQWRWSAQERIGREPALQFLGKGEDSMSLRGLLYPELALARGTSGALGELANAENAGKGVHNQIPLMREVADRGEPLLMIDSKGKNLGYWVIESVDEKKDELFDNGTPRRMEFDIKLKFYGEDRS